METFSIGDGYDYSSLDNAFAAADDTLTLTEDYYFPIYYNSGSSRIYEHTSNITIPTFNTSSGVYKIIIEGMVGNIKDLTSQIQLKFSSSATSGLYGGSMTDIGLIIKNLNLESSVGQCSNINNVSMPTFKDCYIKQTDNNYAVVARAMPQFITSIIIGSASAAGLYLSAGNGMVGIKSIFRGGSGISPTTRNFGRLDGCIVYGETDYGLYQLPYWWYLTNSVIVGKTYSIGQALDGYKAASTCINNCIFYSEDNPTKFNSDGDIETALLGYLDYNYFNISLSNPIFSKTGNDLDFFVPGENSLIRTKNQTKIENPLWNEQYLDIFSYGSWSDYQESIEADVPEEEDVRYLTVYDNGNKTGSLHVPLPEETVAGVLVDDTIGTYRGGGNGTITITGYILGSRIQLYDLDNDIELYNDIPDDTTLVYILDDGSTIPEFDDGSTIPDSEYYMRLRTRVMYTSSQIDNGDTINEEEVITSKKFIEELDTIDILGIIKIIRQEDDEIYITNNIDGSAIDNITIDEDNSVIEVDAEEISWGQIYAYRTYWLSTEDGIASDNTVIEAYDIANYFVIGYTIKNITSPSLPLIIGGGYGKDSITEEVITIINTTGGTIFCAPDHVVPFSSTSITTSTIQEGLDAQGYTSNRAINLDNLDEKVSSRSTKADVINASQL